MFKGLNIFGVEILSVTGIKDKNDELDTALEKVSTLTSVDQPKAMQELNDSAKQLILAKEEYNDKILYSSSDDIAEAAITRPYQTEFLQTVVGNHAKDNYINLRYELKPTGVESEYDMHYTITGSYVAITGFVESLENDSSLNFKIENFKLVPTQDSNENLQATFVVKGLNVKVEGTNKNTSTTDNTENQS